MMDSTPSISTERIEQFYSELFSDNFFVFDQTEPYFQEKLVQIIWNEQLFHKDTLLNGGQTLSVVHPGVWNLEAGPDFHDATLFIDNQARRGSVEIHLRPEDWQRHGHQHDPTYDNVILHVVWDNPNNHRSYPPNIPILTLKDNLTEPLYELIERVDVTGYPYARQVQPAAAAEQIAKMSTEHLTEVFQSYGIARILQKAQRVGRQVQEIGLDETAYRLICDALGYKNNRESFAQLAEILPLREFQNSDFSTAMAMLFGAAGMLPDPSRDPILPARDKQVRELWRLWWGRRKEYRQISWNRRQRPFNAPERRILALALLLKQCGLRPGTTIIETFRTATTGKEALQALRKKLTLDDAAWQSFYSFSKPLEKGGALLGKSRLDDLLVNVAIPLFLSWCFLQNQPQECHKGRQALAAMARLQNNRTFKEAAGHFFVPPSRAKTIITNACSQQGLLKIYKDFLELETVVL